MIPECEHGMPTPAACSECMYEGVMARKASGKPPAVVFKEAEPLTARFDGYCRPCACPITPGESIVLLDNGNYVHVECAP